MKSTTLAALIALSAFSLAGRGSNSTSKPESGDDKGGTSTAVTTPRVDVTAKTKTACEAISAAPDDEDYPDAAAQKADLKKYLEMAQGTPLAGPYRRLAELAEKSNQIGEDGDMGDAMSLMTQAYTYWAQIQAACDPVGVKLPDLETSNK